MENLKNPFDTYLFPLSSFLFLGGKAPGFLFVNCGNLFQPLVFSPLKPIFSFKNLFWSFQHFFPQRKFDFSIRKNKKSDFSALFSKFSTGATSILSTKESLFIKRIFTGAFVENFWLIHSFFISFPHLLKTLWKSWIWLLKYSRRFFYACPIISFFISPISKENMGSSW